MTISNYDGIEIIFKTLQHRSVLEKGRLFKNLLCIIFSDNPVVHRDRHAVGNGCFIQLRCQKTITKYKPTILSLKKEEATLKAFVECDYVNVYLVSCVCNVDH